MELYKCEPNAFSYKSMHCSPDPTTNSEPNWVKKVQAAAYNGARTVDNTGRKIRENFRILSFGIGCWIR